MYESGTLPVREARGEVFALHRVVLTCAVALVGCHEPLVYDVATGPRDWAAHPAVVSLEPAGDVYAVSDIHGGYDRFVALLQRHGLVDANLAWTGGDATLVVAGDLFDKGAKGLEVIDLLRNLQASAPSSGGAVVVTLGNHEAEFFEDPTNSKAESDDGIDAELATDQIDLVAIASGAEAHGLWLRQQPFAARVGDAFFSHAGDTHGRSLAALDDALRVAFDTNDFKDAQLTGSDSLLESRGWYGAQATVDHATQALGVRHIVFGHDPSALGARGAIASARDGALFRIDCGMSPDVDDSHGALWRLRKDGTDEVVEQLAADGSIKQLWRGPAP